MSRQQLATKVTTTLLVLLATLGAVSSNSGASAEKDLPLQKVTASNIHDMYAVDLVREEEFCLKPQEAVNILQQHGYDIVVAPSGSDDADVQQHQQQEPFAHPMLFYCQPRHFQIMRKNSLVTPQYTIIVFKDAISVTHRITSMEQKLSDEQLAALKTFCNWWNAKARMSTCFVDKEKFLNLHNDIQLVATAGGDEQVAELAHHANVRLVLQGVKLFEESLRYFAKRVVNDIVLRGVQDEL